jgi:enolase
MLGFPIAAMPRLAINLFSGGKHAGRQVAVQDVLIILKSARTLDQALVQAADVYHAAAELTLKKYGMRPLTADEGGLAPPFKTVEEMFATAVEAIERAGYVPGKDIFLAVDVASTHFYRNNFYEFDSEVLDSDEMIRRIAGWLDCFPIISVEDGLSEDDWEHWPKLRQANAGKALTVGDDLLCTNLGRIRRAIEGAACDALLLKVNQVGTLTEALAAYQQARSARWSVTLSVRSGETEDNWAADLAVGWQADQFKNGSIRQSERLAKYNRLLEIAEDTNLEFAK